MPDLPVDVPLDVEDVEEDVGVGEEGGQGQRGQALRVDDPGVGAQLKGHVEHVHLVQDGHHVAHVVAVRVDRVGVGSPGEDEPGVGSSWCD